MSPLLLNSSYIDSFWDGICDFYILFFSNSSSPLNSPPFPPDLNTFPLSNFDETFYIDSLWYTICDVYIFFCQNSAPTPFLFEVDVSLLLDVLSNSGCRCIPSSVFHLLFNFRDKNIIMGDFNAHTVPDTLRQHVHLLRRGVP